MIFAIASWYLVVRRNICCAKLMHELWIPQGYSTLISLRIANQPPKPTEGKMEVCAEVEWLSSIVERHFTLECWF